MYFSFHPTQQLLLDYEISEDRFFSLPIALLGCITGFILEERSYGMQFDFIGDHLSELVLDFFFILSMASFCP